MLWCRCSAEDRREYLEGLLRGSKKQEVVGVLDDEALNYILARRLFQQSLLRWCLSYLAHLKLIENLKYQQD